MSSTVQQIAITVAASVITAGCIGLVSANFVDGENARQIKINTLQIEKNTLAVADIPVLKSNVIAMERRLDTYEKLVIEGQKDILKELSAMRVDSAKNATEIGAIKIDISEIKDSINN